MVRVTLEFEKRFSNGTFIFDRLGKQISPESPEGRAIEEILQKQKITREENAAQRKKFEVITGKDIDGDGKIGDEPIIKPVSKPNKSKKKRFKIRNNEPEFDIEE